MSAAASLPVLALEVLQQHEQEHLQKQATHHLPTLRQQEQQI